MTLAIRLRAVLVGIPLFALSAACTGPTASSIKDDDASSTAEDPAALCGEGTTYSSFHIEASTSLPSASDLPISGNLQVLSSGSAQQIRLDVCVDDATEEPTLKQIAQRELDNGVVNVYPATEASVVQGLRKAVFDGADESLEIFVLLMPDISQTVGILVKGPTGSGPVIAGVVERDASGAYSAYGGYVIAGALIFGDPFVAGACPAGYDLDRGAITIGSATIEFEACTSQLNISGKNYRLKQVTVTDDNAALSPDRRGTRTLTGDDLQASVQSKIGHHNACDAVDIVLPGARYAVTSRVHAPSCDGFLKAPAITAAGTAGSRVYVRYGTAPAVITTIDSCSHFLFSCP